MTWFGWLMIAINFVGVLGTVTSVGKPRKRISPDVAALNILVCTAVILGYLLVGTGRL